MAKSKVKLPVGKVAVLSTKYISESDGELLTMFAKMETPHGLPRMENHEYGWFMFVAPEKDQAKECRAALRGRGFSAAFQRIYRLAHEQDVCMVNFDQDGVEGVELEAFYW